jgi:hypothetical protein
VEYLGAAAVSEGRVSGVLTADETQLALRLFSEAKRRVARHGDDLQLQFLLPKDSDLLKDIPRIHDLMAKLQTLDSDALFFGGITAMTFRTNAEWEAYHFRNKYRTAEIAIAIK